MYKLIATDMDGTLLNSDKKITKETFESIKKAKQNKKKVVLATGRPLPGVIRYLDELNLNEDGDFVICFNGALVQEVKTKNVISNIEMSYSDYKLIHKFAKENNLNIHINTPTNLVIPDDNPNQYTKLEADLNQIDIVTMSDEEIKQNVTFCKIMIIDSPEKLEEVITLIPKELYDNYTVVRSAPYFLEFLNKEANKGNALKKLCKHLGLSLDEVIAIGDEENDKHMIEYAGLGVAMGNARDTIKEIANHITTTNNEDGVAKVIDEFLLK